MLKLGKFVIKGKNSSCPTSILSSCAKMSTGGGVGGTSEGTPGEGAGKGGGGGGNYTITFTVLVLPIFLFLFIKD